MNFIPSCSEKLLQLVKTNIFPIPKQCDIDVGSEDWQSNPANVQKLSSLIGIDVSIVPNASHLLPKEYVGALLDKWTAPS